MEAEKSNSIQKTWHHQAIEAVLADLKTDSNSGLTKEEAARRQEEYGPNELKSGEGVSALHIFIEQFKNALILILLVATLISGVLGHVVEAISIGIIILFAILLGFFQELRAGKAIEALKKMAAPHAKVVRGGQEIELPAPELVPGDLIILHAGDRVPADCRLLEVINLKADEAGLTGESVPVEKNATLEVAENAVVGDRKNMLFSGTSITYGRGKAVVAATGMQTEFGAIATMLRSVKKVRTPLEKNLDQVGKTLTKAAFFLVAIVAVIGLIRGETVLDMLIFGIALAVAVVPEALPAVVTISLAIGVQRMVKRHALVRQLPAVETLGSTTMICSDKTGTLTKDEMTVRKILFNGNEELDVTGSGYEPKGEFLAEGKSVTPTDNLKLLLTAASLCSDVELHKIENEWDIKGDPTEGGLVVAAAKASLEKKTLDAANKRTDEIPFSSETKRMTTLHETTEGPVAYGKGAAEIVLESCSEYMSKEGVKPLTEEIKASILKKIEQFGEEALRVIGVAYRPTNGKSLKEAEKDMIFLGMFGMIDPPRPEAKTAIEECKQAGIQIMMITGDHPITATAIAKELGILKPEGKVVTGVELSAMSDEDLQKNIESIEVCARVSPEHKLRVVQALQAQDHIVAMTGDGINDAPALKKANIGVAMGITGTEVSKEAAAMTLMDDNFASIVAAVEEGRIIYGNIKKYLMYLLSANIGEIGLMTIASIAGLPLPLSAVQLLYVNLVTDGLPALALAIDPPEKDVMERKPEKMRKSIFTRPVVVLMMIGGGWSTLVNICLFLWALSSGRPIEECMTLVFVSLILIEFFKAYAFRSDRNPIYQKMFANKWLNRSIFVELILLFVVIYVPFFQTPFGTYPLTVTDWLILILPAMSVIPALEFGKWMLRKKMAE